MAKSKINEDMTAEEVAEALGFEMNPGRGGGADLKRVSDGQTFFLTFGQVNASTNKQLASFIRSLGKAV